MRRAETGLPMPPADDRPNDHWQCGVSCDGPGWASCPRCPLHRGVTRSLQCGAGIQLCRPARTAAGRRRLIVVTTVSAGIMLLIALSVLAPQRFYKPGPLSQPHALILAEASHAQSCAACHPAASSSIVSWFRSAGAGHDNVSQTDRCIDCHHTRLPSHLARSPHNLPQQRLDEIRSASSHDVAGAWVGSIRNVSSNNLNMECAACHREHRGADAHLSLLSNAQCQSCHSRTFTSFAEGHPQWSDWPYTNHATISFDHASHAGNHFPKAAGENGSLGRRFDCAGCHPRGESGEPRKGIDYQRACAECHDATLRQQSSERLDLVALPGLPDDVAARAAPWPPAATGFFDADVSPLARWLIRGDSDAAAALARLPRDSDFTSVDPQHADQRQAAADIAIALRSLLDELATNGTASSLLQRNDRTTASMRQLLRGVPPQLIWDARYRWFSAPPTTEAFELKVPPRSLDQAIFKSRRLNAPSIKQAAAASDELLGSDRLLDVDDPLSRDRLAKDDDLLLLNSRPNEELNSPSPTDTFHAPTQQRFDPIRMLPDGGWYRDDLRLAISYRGGQHADPVLQAAVELAAGLAQDDLVRRGLLASGPVAACVQCHPGALRPSGSVWHHGAAAKGAAEVNREQAITVGLGSSAFDIQQRYLNSSQPTQSLTRFSHRPHFTLPQLTDCTHCHQVAEASPIWRRQDSLTSQQVAFTESRQHGFAPLKKDTCTSCHHAAAAGDACTQCHRYHALP
jgi:hypothetical protein